MQHLFTRFVIAAVLSSFLYGCAATSKIVIPSYSAPREYKKIAEIESGGDLQSGSYLSLAIDPELDGVGITKEPGLTKMLINSVKEGITETNFITLYPLFDEAYVQLDMSVPAFAYVRSGNSVKADIQVSFTILKGVTEYLSKTYSARVSRQSANPGHLPSKNKVLLDLSKDVTKQFLSDITPRKTNQLREFKSFSSDIEYVLTYAKQGNFESAIDDLEAYEGGKDSDFYYNLAVIYEALGSKNADVEMFKKANKNYRKSMAMGGASDELVVKTKARFDNFFRLFKMTEQQRQENQQLNQELNDTYGIE